MKAVTAERSAENSAQIGAKPLRIQGTKGAQAPRPRRKNRSTCVRARLKHRLLACQRNDRIKGVSQVGRGFGLGG